jgi:PIN domain nuclease of toxin-antitoxin system
MRRTSSVMASRADPQPLLLLDTHIWVWQMAGNRTLSPRTRRAIDEASIVGGLRLSVMTLWEIALLASRNRLQLGKPAAAWIADSLAPPGPRVEQLSEKIAIEAGELPGGFRSDPADQIIVATARLTGATLLTRDRRILAYAEAGHLNAIAA